MSTPPRALDHLVLPCADLDAAGRAWENLGFLVGRRNRHPWGTENRIVQCPWAFIELIALAPDYVPLNAHDDAFPFAGFLAGQGGSRRPSGMIVLRSEDARADARLYAESGIGAGRMLDFARQGRAPDGAIRTVAFSLAFASPSMPDVGFFVCQQHNPENFWNPAAQRHPNGVTGIATVTIAAERPADHAGFLTRFSGAPPVAAKDGTLTVALAEGAAIVVEPRPGPAAIIAVGFRTGSGATTSARWGALDLAFVPAA